MLGGNTIGDWTPSYLTRFVEDWFRSQALPIVPTLAADTIILDGEPLTTRIEEAVSTALPPGVIAEYGAATAPSGWLLCDGSAVSRKTYPNLYAVIGTTWGAGDGSTTFNLPDHRGRVPVGKNAATFSALAGTGGEETHTLTLAETPAHDHGGTTGATSGGTPAGTLSSVSAGTPAGTISTPTFTGTALGTHSHNSFSTSPGMRWVGTVTLGSTNKGVSDVGGITGSTAANTGDPTTSAVSAGTPAGTISTPTFTGTSMGTHTHTFTGSALATHTHTITSVGSSGAHNNLQPYLVVNFIIKT